jgi:hypothetical protein
MGDSISWALGEEGDVVPDSAYERAKVEASYHNAFKVFEAAIGGEPPKDRRELAERLRRIGVDPERQFGFKPRGTEPLMDSLLRVWKTRDEKAAHAGQTSAPVRDITPFELMEAQYAAAEMLGQAVIGAKGENSAAERRAGPARLNGH